jgi:hypothetical protein
MSEWKQDVLLDRQCAIGDRQIGLRPGAMADRSGRSASSLDPHPARARPPSSAVAGEGKGRSSTSHHLTEWKLLIMKDVTGCCCFVATLLLVKCLIINDVTDVAGFKTIISISELVNQ